MYELGLWLGFDLDQLLTQAHEAASHNDERGARRFDPRILASRDPQKEVGCKPIYGVYHENVVIYDVLYAVIDGVIML